MDDEPDNAAEDAFDEQIQADYNAGLLDGLIEGCDAAFFAGICTTLAAGE